MWILEGNGESATLKWKERKKKDSNQVCMFTHGKKKCSVGEFIPSLLIAKKNVDGAMASMVLCIFQFLDFASSGVVVTVREAWHFSTGFAARVLAFCVCFFSF